MLISGDCSCAHIPLPFPLNVMSYGMYGESYDRSVYGRSLIYLAIGLPAKREAKLLPPGFSGSASQWKIKYSFNIAPGWNIL